MISRRQFLAWAVATPVIAIPAVKYFLPPKGGWPTGYFDLSQLRYKSYERHSFGGTDVRAFYGTSDGVALRSAAHPNSYLTSDTAWYLKTEVEPWSKESLKVLFAQHPGDFEDLYDEEPMLYGFGRDPREVDTDSLSESSLENIVIEVKEVDMTRNPITPPRRRLWKA